jgi:hypothetical protein
MQALSQLSYSPINDHLDQYPDARSIRAWNLRGRRLRRQRGCYLAVSHPGGKRLFQTVRHIGRNAGSALVGRAANVEVEVFVLVFVFLEEHVLVVIANVFNVFDVLDLGNILALVGIAGLFGVGILERDDLRSCRIGFLGLDFFFVLVDLTRSRGLGAHRGNGVLLEEGARIGFAGVGRDDRILVQIVELLAGIGVFPFRTAFVLGQLLASS